eukprot:5720033-Heterocapsa_arctica.AAC.1
MPGSGSSVPDEVVHITGIGGSGFLQKKHVMFVDPEEAGLVTVVPGRHVCRDDGEEFPFFRI